VLFTVLYELARIAYEVEIAYVAYFGFHIHLNGPRTTSKISVIFYVAVESRTVDMF
jgi:hypothetical protein